MIVEEELKTTLQDIRKRLQDVDRFLVQGQSGTNYPSFEFVHETYSPREKFLRETLLETIAVLEETRKAFKSKHLAALRKKLIRVLAENP